jgi:hypothetical protein
MQKVRQTAPSSLVKSSKTRAHVRIPPYSTAMCNASAFNIYQAVHRRSVRQPTEACRCDMALGTTLWLIVVSCRGRCIGLALCPILVGSLLQRLRMGSLLLLFELLRQIPRHGLVRARLQPHPSASCSSRVFTSRLWSSWAWPPSSYAPLLPPRPPLLDPQTLRLPRWRPLPSGLGP